MESPNMTLGAVLLAAGASTRMGKPKMLLPWGDTSVLGSLIRQWTRLGASPVAVVVARDNPAIAAELRRLDFPEAQWVRNPDPAEGMFSSIRCAAAWPHWPSTLTHCALVLGDQPHLPDPLLSTLLHFAAGRPDRICQPSRVGRPRHPVIFPMKSFLALAGAPEANLKEFLENRRADRALLPTEDPAFDLDLDYPSDYDLAVNVYLHSK